MAKIAGPTGPTPKLGEDINALLSAPREDMKRLFVWLAAPEHPIPSVWRDYAAIAKELELSEEFISDHFALIQFVVANWKSEGLSLDEVVEDLREISVAENDLGYARELFALLEGSKERFYIATLRGKAEIVGIPTMDELRAVWDIRPVFEASPFAPNDETTATDQWLTNTYLLVLEITYSSRNSPRKTVSLQLSESEVDIFQETIAKAKSQLQSIKRKQFI